MERRVKWWNNVIDDVRYKQTRPTCSPSHQRVLERLGLFAMTFTCSTLFHCGNSIRNRLKISGCDPSRWQTIIINYIHLIILSSRSSSSVVVRFGTERKAIFIPSFLMTTQKTCAWPLTVVRKWWTENVDRVYKLVDNSTYTWKMDDSSCVQSIALSETNVNLRHPLLHLMLPLISSSSYSKRNGSMLI